MVKEIKYFHPSGMSMPNGSHYQRGGFLKECKDNFNNYILDEGVHDEQYGLADYRGGIITFSTNVNAVKFNSNIIVDKVKQAIETINNRLNYGNKIHKLINNFNSNNEKYIGAYSVGNFFKGKYVGDNGEEYSEKSLSIEVNGLSSKSFLIFAEMLADAFMQEIVLVKDLSKNKIYLVDSKPMPTDVDDALTNINKSV